jgi:sulfate transport system ATP-binding protein
VLVTHDRDEAMEVADNIAVMDQGQIVQVAAPKELYDKPSSPFVMKFLGPVNQVGDGFVRPHDMELRPSPNGTTIPARILRLLHLGFEVRVELEQADGERIWAQVTRDEADALDLRADQTIFVRPRRQMLFAAGSGI